MSFLDIQYNELLMNIMMIESNEKNRTGVDAIVYPHTMIRHEMSTGFPILTTKKMSLKNIAVELEFFIRGETSKKWLQDRGCHIWDEWCNPSKIPPKLEGEERKAFMKKCDDLGPVYGSQWRDFNGDGELFNNERSDQLKNIVQQLKTNPTNRQLVCSAWNPLRQNEMALPSCHVCWHVFISGGKIHLCWFQRSCDTFLGVPYNITSYGLLLHLLSLETGIEAGILTGFLSNVHIYKNHLIQVREQMGRDTSFTLPTINTNKFTGIFDWHYDQSSLVGYQCHEAIKAPIAV